MPSRAARVRALEVIRKDVISCERCPRLRKYCAAVAREKKAAYRDWDYWGRPVPAFGDPDARIVIVGLAPAAHGGNRTGRIFTGDRSGDFLYEALYRVGLANQPTSKSRDDGLQLKGAWITAAARCAPPGNKPLPVELDNCLEYMVRELEQLTTVKAAVTLGKIGHDALIKALRRRGLLKEGRFPFGHGVVHELPKPLPAIVCSYHVSQQNTFTGKLTKAMFDDVLKTALRLAEP
jgi:uracil-DNA glycosylase family 4